MRFSIHRQRPANKRLQPTAVVGNNVGKFSERPLPMSRERLWSHWGYCVAFDEERALAERALELADMDSGGEPVFPPVSNRFLRAREALGLTQSEVAAHWGEPPSMYMDLELYDSEAFDVLSVEDLVKLAAILQVSVQYLLFGSDPLEPLAVTSYPEIVRQLRARMQASSMSVNQLSDAAGWELAEFLDAPERLATLPIFGLRWVCRVAGVDWATTLTNPRPA